MDDNDTSGKKIPEANAKNKKMNSEQPDSVPAHAGVEPKPKRGWNMGAIFWGLLLIAFGGLLLLGNLGVVEVNWSELWRLWPLLIVASGFSVLATTHWLWKVLSLVFIIAAIFAVIWVGTGRYEANTSGVNVQNISVNTKQDVSRADVSIKAGASKINVDSDDMADVVSARLESDGLRLDEDNSRDGMTQVVELSTSAYRGKWFGLQQNTWDITLTERLPMKLTIDAGASSIDADLSRVRLTDLTVKAGASNTVITLGDTVAKFNVDIDSGASSTTLRIPSSSGVAMTFDGGLSSREFEDLKEVSKGEYQSDNYKTAKNVIIINVDAGLASFKIERY